MRFVGIEECVEATLSRVGKQIVLGLPVAIGKPNALVNAFVARALADASISLTIVTALSLRAPRWHSDMERRFVEPFAQRVFGNYPELEYVRLIEQRLLNRRKGHLHIVVSDEHGKPVTCSDVPAKRVEHFLKYRAGPHDRLKLLHRFPRVGGYIAQRGQGQEVDEIPGDDKFELLALPKLPRQAI